MFAAWMAEWEARPLPHRIALAIALAAALVLPAVAAWWLMRSPYEVLFAGLRPEDAASIAAQLSADGTDYELDDGVVRVRQGGVHAARLRVMERGLPLQGPVGFELFDHVELGASDFTQQVNYQRALEGELVRTVSALDEVEHARLHLVLPSASPFRRPSETPKASLTLILRPGAVLSAARVRGIRRLVAAAVAGLAPGEVAVQDQAGTSLGGEGAGSSAGADLETKQAHEQYLAAKAQAVLDRAFGVDVARVLVDVTLDPERRHVTREEALPVAGGVTGAVVRQRASAAPRAEGESARNRAGAPLDTEVEYQVGRQVEEIERTAGAVRRLTAAVLVPPGTDESTRHRMESAVASALGADTTRGDTVVVQEMPELTPATLPSAPAASPGRPAMSAAVLPGAVAMAAGLLLGAALGRSLGATGERRHLSPAQRQQMLARVTQWLAGRPAP